MNSLFVTKQDSGRQAEDLAAKYLKKHKLNLITKNFLCRHGEIDLICREGNTLVFVEVRFRHNKEYGSAAESINHSKQQKVIMAAKYWMMQNKCNKTEVRFDAVLFDQKIDYQHLTWLKAAF